MKITTISARVMRSYDYSHFEIVLGATVDAGDDSNAQVLAATDELRKAAARLADKAVRQYMTAKANRVRLASEERDYLWESNNAERLKKLPETERSPEQQAQLKAHQDRVWEASRRFDYEDDWRDEDEEDQA